MNTTKLEQKLNWPLLRRDIWAIWGLETSSRIGGFHKTPQDASSTACSLPRLPAGRCRSILENFIRSIFNHWAGTLIRPDIESCKAVQTLCRHEVCINFLFSVPFLELFSVYARVTLPYHIWKTQTNGGIIAIWSTSRPTMRQKLFWAPRYEDIYSATPHRTAHKFTHRPRIRSHSTIIT